MKSSIIVWHYAPLTYRSKIVDSGYLEPSNVGASESELPLLWFLANQTWEPTATKFFSDKDGRMRQLSFADQAGMLGCMSFGLDGDDPRLLNWKAACAAAQIRREMRRSMEAVGKRKGATPSHWFATSQPIPLAELMLEIWGGKWEPGDATP